MLLFSSSLDPKQLSYRATRASDASSPSRARSSLIFINSATAADANPFTTGAADERNLHLVRLVLFPGERERPSADYPSFPAVTESKSVFSGLLFHPSPSSRCAADPPASNVTGYVHYVAQITTTTLQTTHTVG